MGLSQKLILRQGQSLVMTPQLQQAIKLLQMSALELQSFVESEIEKNPLLEREEQQSIDAKTVSDDTPAALDQALPQGGGDDASVEQMESSAPSASADGQSLAPDSGWSSLRTAGHLSLDGEDQDFASSLTRDVTLAEHLSNQLNLHVMAAPDRLVGQHLIGMVNETGYLTADLASMAETLGTDVAHVERILAILQTFEPTGVFARDLAECLRLQLKERDRLDPAMAKLVDHLDLVAKRDFVGLRQKCGVSQDDLTDMLQELRSLNPKPGHAYGSEPVSPVVPDVIVRPSPDGTWIVELNSETLPRVLVNNQYMAKVAKNTSREEDKLFLAGCQQQAAWLVKSLDQRANTVLKVAREIVSQQDAFLVHGIQHLKPITLKTVADAISMHESTVSRVTSNKYMQTPRGIHELKYFFTNAIAATDGEGDGHSAESVRHRIRELVAAERADAILSDDDIVAALRRDSVDVARRTVAKYRESLGILSSVQRRREARIKG
jgi:RNA polymerase sigma-54 factor